MSSKRKLESAAATTTGTILQLSYPRADPELKLDGVSREGLVAMREQIQSHIDKLDAEGIAKEVESHGFSVRPHGYRSVFNKTHTFLWVRSAADDRLKMFEYQPDWVKSIGYDARQFDISACKASDSKMKWDREQHSIIQSGPYSRARSIRVDIHHRISDDCRADGWIGQMLLSGGDKPIDARVEDGAVVLGAAWKLENGWNQGMLIGRSGMRPENGGAL